jgi:hypothetical protein
MVIHTVEADDNGSFEFGVFQGFEAFNEIDKGSYGKGKKVKKGQEKGCKDKQE